MLGLLLISLVWALLTGYVIVSPWIIHPPLYYWCSTAVTLPISASCFSDTNGCLAQDDSQVVCDIAGLFASYQGAYSVKAADCGCTRSETGDICRYSCFCVPRLVDEVFAARAGDLNTACAKAGHPVAGCPTLVDLLRTEVSSFGFPFLQVDDVMYCRM